MRILKTVIYIFAVICVLGALPVYAECGNIHSTVSPCDASRFDCTPSAAQDKISRNEGTICGRPSFEMPCREQCPPCAPAVESTASPTVAPTAEPTTAPTAQPAATYVSDGSLAAEVVRQVNAERAKYGLAALEVDSDLASAACVRASEITRHFSHTRPNGDSWSTVSALAKGENIAMGYASADKIMAAWMSSEGHRANILRESFSTIGVCAYEYNGVIYWVQLFGTN